MHPPNVTHAHPHPLQPPLFNRATMDIHKLFRAVMKAGGHDAVVQQKGWVSGRALHRGGGCRLIGSQGSDSQPGRRSDWGRPPSFDFSKLLLARTPGKVPMLGATAPHLGAPISIHPPLHPRLETSLPARRPPPCPLQARIGRTFNPPSSMTGAWGPASCGLQLPCLSSLHSWPHQSLLTKAGAGPLRQLAEQPVFQYVLPAGPCLTCLPAFPNPLPADLSFQTKKIYASKLLEFEKVGVVSAEGVGKLSGCRGWGGKVSILRREIAPASSSCQQACSCPR